MFIQNNFLVNRLCIILVCYTEKHPTKTQQKLVICRFSAKKRKKKKKIYQKRSVKIISTICCDIILQNFVSWISS